MSKSYSIRTNVRDDFVPLAYNDQGGKTDATVKVVPPASRDGGGRIKTKRNCKPPSTSYAGGVNLANFGVDNPLPNLSALLFSK